MCNFMLHDRRSPAAIIAILLALTGIVIGPFSLGIHPVAGATQTTLTAFLVSQPGNPTALSPQNQGTGGGSSITVPVPTVSSINVISNQLLFSSSSATFTGTGFSATIDLGGIVNQILQLEGPQGLIPDFCWGFKKNGSQLLDGPFGCSGSQDSGRTPLAGPGIISTQSFSSIYAAVQSSVGPSDTVDYSIAFGQETPSSGQTITIHYGGTTAQTTSFFQLPIARPVTQVNVYLGATPANSQALLQANTGSGPGRSIAMPVLSADFQTLINSLFSSPSRTLFTGTGFSGTVPQAGIVFFQVRLEGPLGDRPNICFSLTKNGTSFLDGFILCNQAQSPLGGPGVSVLETLGFIYTFIDASLTPSDAIVLTILLGEPGAPAGEQVILHYGGTTPESTSFFQIPMIGATPPPPPLTVTTHFTDTYLNPLPLDSNGRPKVDVVLTNGTVMSTNPGQILATANFSNTGSAPLQSLKANLTLPVDWAVFPNWIPAKGAIHVLLANNTSSANSLDITQQTTIMVSNTNPQLIQLTIPSFNNTMIGHPLMPGQSLLLTAKLAYALKGTSQNHTSYPRNYTDTASANAWTGPTFTGTAFTANASSLFTGNVKVLGDVDGDLKVDITDVALVAYSFGSRPGDANWNPNADVGNYGVVCIQDVAYVAYYFGTSA